jgi:hypothetical protein
VFEATVGRLRELRLSFLQLGELADIDTGSDYHAYLDRLTHKQSMK